MVLIRVMMAIFHKWKINPFTYFIFLSFLLTGYIKNILLIFLILCIHELGHIFFLKRFSYSITRVEIFPFGGITTTEKPINTPINQDICIYLGGVLFQGLLFLLFSFFYKNGFLYENTYNLFLKYNTSILCFNLLPIKPLDGGEILELLFEKFFPYAKSFSLSIIVSFLFLLIFLLYNIKCNLNGYIVISFLLYKILDFTKKKEHYKNKFYLERYLYTFPYKKIEHHEVQDITLLKKETLHFFKENQKYRHEKEILQEKFDIHTYF